MSVIATIEQEIVAPGETLRAGAAIPNALAIAVAGLGGGPIVIAGDGDGGRLT